MTSEKKKGCASPKDAPVSLAPLAFEEAIRATLATGKAPPPPKRKPKGKK